MNENPQTLAEAFTHLVVMGPEEAQLFGEMDEEDAVSKSHHGMGRWVRNEWGLWKESGALYEYLKKLGLWHPDDMSSLILRSFHRFLNGKSLDLEEQVNDYRAYWNEQGVDGPPVKN